MSVRANVPKLYTYSFFHNLIFAYVIERLFWAGRGITVRQVVYLECIYAAVVTLLEVPTGALADRWSRKWMLVLSAVCACGEFAFLIYAYDFGMFALAMVCAGIAGAMASGTINALLYDSLASTGDAQHFEKVLGRFSFVDRLAAALAALAGGVIAARFNLVVNYWLSSISLLISLATTLWLREPAIRSAHMPVDYRQQIKDAAVFLGRQGAIRIVAVYGVILAATLIYIDEFWQIYLAGIGLPVILFGPFCVILSLAAGIAALLAYRFKRRHALGAVFTGMVFIYAGAILAAGCLRDLRGAFLLLVAYFVAGFADPLIAGYLQHRLDSGRRATVESCQAMVLRIFSITVGLLFSYFADRWGIFAAYRALGIVTLAYGLYFAIRHKKELDRHEA